MGVANQKYLAANTIEKAPRKTGGLDVESRSYWLERALRQAETASIKGAE